MLYLNRWGWSRVPLTPGQRGKVFERIINQILTQSGFSSVVTDNNLIYDGPSGKMLHGLAQPHNTDVLVDPPYQIPFFHRSRLIIECKAYKKSIGLPVLRNALGLRIDINNFDIVTPDMLTNRRDYKRGAPVVASFDRYLYQVAVASMSGFTMPAQEFAIVHRIPLINFQNMPFTRAIVDILFDGNSEEEELNENNERNDQQIINQKWEIINGHINNIFKKFDIAILSSGDIIFLYTESGEKWYFNVDEIELHWSEEKEYWRMTSHNQRSNEDETWFELPRIIFGEWSKTGFSKEAALDLKEREFQNIFIMGVDEHNKKRLKLVTLSKEFLTFARDQLRGE